jgi:2-dehydro-3-deoxyphosphogluconate aldolase/(4S)-4-hydroxy-2-oxoglutarate aldolase
MMAGVIETILETRLVGIIRLPQYSEPVEIAQALVQGGVRVLEFSLTGEGALQAIAAARRALGLGFYVGAGTVRSVSDVAGASQAGADFIVTPAFKPDVIQACKQRGLALLCGALTPTEIVSALEAGADLIKLFPARLGGPRYVKDLLGPFPELKLVPTGGVNLENASAYLEAGAVAVAIGGSLVPGEAVARRQFAEITRVAADCVQAVSNSGSNPG